MKPILNNFGLDYVFDAGFNANTGKSLVIDDIVQKAFIEVNEEGTESLPNQSISHQNALC